MNRRARRGFSQIELMVSVGLVTILLGLGLTNMKRAQTAGSSRGLATAVAAELRLARERAIAKGSPIALVFPGGVSQALFILEGETDPRITRTVSYAGDYPNGGIAVATYPGPSFQQNVVIPGAKSLEWQQRLDTWLPAAHRNDFVFLFLPNGSVVTNDLPAAEGSYRVVVAAGLDVNPAGAPGGTDYVSGNDSVYFDVNAAGEPYTVSVSQSGAVESDKGLLGYTGSGITPASTLTGNPPAPPGPEVNYTAQAPNIFFLRVTPPAEDVDGEEVHVLNKGEYLTLEAFAHSSDGRPLYTAWNDQPVTKSGNSAYKGRFSVPDGAPERMEFYPQYDVYEDGRPPENDVWRAVWTWTPPSNADPGDRYALTVDVTDAKQTEVAQLPPSPPNPNFPLKVEVSPPGEVVFESNRDGNWHLYSMWSDGSRVSRITQGPGNYRCASATADGKLIAFERNAGFGDEVWVMNPDGTGQIKVADGSKPTISPNGNSVAYMVADKVVVKRLNSASGAELTPPLDSAETNVVGGLPLDNRLAFSPDGRWVYYTAPAGNAVAGSELNFPGEGINLVQTVIGSAVPNIASVDSSGNLLPQVGGIFAGRGNELYYHADQNDPYLGLYTLSGGAPMGVSSWRVSVGQNEAYPAISPNEDLLLYCEQVGGVYQIVRVNRAGFGASGIGEVITSDGENLRPAWIRQGQRF